MYLLLITPVETLQLVRGYLRRETRYATNYFLQSLMNCSNLNNNRDLSLLNKFVISVWFTMVQWSRAGL